MRSTQSSPKLDEFRLAVPFPTFFDVSAGEVAEKLVFMNITASCGRSSGKVSSI